MKTLAEIKNILREQESYLAERYGVHVVGVFGSYGRQEYLSLLARQGKLEAIKRGRIWHTTRRALQAYLESVGKG